MLPVHTARQSISNSISIYLAKNVTTGDPNINDENRGLMEPSRVKEEDAALDDKLSIELKSIVEQIQVRKLVIQPNVRRY